VHEIERLPRARCSARAAAVDAIADQVLDAVELGCRDVAAVTCMTP
jgi:hypothetical protein